MHHCIVNAQISGTQDPAHPKFQKEFRCFLLIIDSRNAALTKTQTMKKILLAASWTLVLIWASSDHSSAQNTGGTLLWLLNALHLDANPDQIQKINFLLRKSAHFMGYGILAVLWYRALGRWAHWRAWGISFCLACWDEWHQSHLPQRTGSLHDIALDMLGAVLMVSALMALKHCAPSRPQNEKGRVKREGKEDECSDKNV